MESGLVSVVLPNRNHAHFLARALTALRAQTHRNLEIVVVDDASTDESCSLVAGIAAEDARIRLLHLGTHGGINAAVAQGLGHAHGEFLYCAAADDWVAPEFFERAVAVLRSHPASALCFSDPAEHRGEPKAFPLFLSRTPRAYGPDEMAAELRRNYFHISSNTVLYRRTLFEQAGGFRPDLHWLSDWLVNNLLSLRYGASYLPETLTSVTIRAESYSTTNMRRRAPQRELFLRFIDLLGEPEFADVRERFQNAALLPEYRLRDFAWLLTSPAPRHYLTVPLVGRIISRGVWHYLRPLAPLRLRTWLRKRSSTRAQSRTDRRKQHEYDTGAVPPS
jgi:glycosyltransferase involved in cell wall biosynthesis